MVPYIPLPVLWAWPLLVYCGSTRTSNGQSDAKTEHGPNGKNLGHRTPTHATLASEAMCSVCSEVHIGPI